MSELGITLARTYGGRIIQLDFDGKNHLRGDIRFVSDTFEILTVSELRAAADRLERIQGEQTNPSRNRKTR